MLPTPKISKFDHLKIGDAGNIFLTLAFVTISFIFLRYFQWHWSRRGLYKAAKQFNGPVCLPFIGNALFIASFAKEFFIGMPTIFAKYGNPVRVWLGPTLVVGIIDPVDVDLLMNSPASLERCADLRYAEILGNGLVTASSKSWKIYKKIIQPTMGQQVLDKFMETFVEQSKILADILKEDVGKDCDIFDRLFKSTLDSICETSMGIKINNQSQENFYGAGLNRYLALAFMRMYKFWQQPNFLFKLSPNCKIMEDLEVQLRQFSDNIIKMKREERRVRKLERTESEDAIIMDTGLKKKTFIEMLLDISDNSKGFTDKNIRDEAATMIAAGSDTTATSDCFILLCLALHPEIQEKVYKEVTEQLGPDRLVEKQDLAHFRYLELVIKEALRLFPVFPYIARECHNDVKLSNNKVIPAGTIAGVMIYAIQTDEKNWSEPMKFDPERFLPENVAKRHYYSYLAFGAGPRNCIGKTYAMMSMKTTMAMLVRKYKFFTDYKSVGDVKLKIEGAFSKPLQGYKVTLQERV